MSNMRFFAMPHLVGVQFSLYRFVRNSIMKAWRHWLLVPTCLPSLPSMSNDNFDHSFDIWVKVPHFSVMPSNPVHPPPSVIGAGTNTVWTIILVPWWLSIDCCHSDCSGTMHWSRVYLASVYVVLVIMVVGAGFCLSSSAISSSAASNCWDTNSIVSRRVARKDAFVLRYSFPTPFRILCATLCGFGVLPHIL